MGLFHKTLEDIHEYGKEGQFLPAMRVLNEHIAADHEFNSDLAGLQGALQSYTHALRELQEQANGLLTKRKSETGAAKALTEKELKKVFRDKVYNARMHLIKVEALIIKLRKDRLDLR